MAFEIPKINITIPPINVGNTNIDPQNIVPTLSKLNPIKDIPTILPSGLPNNGNLTIPTISVDMKSTIQNPISNFIDSLTRGISGSVNNSVNEIGKNAQGQINQAISGMIQSASDQLNQSLSQAFGGLAPLIMSAVLIIIGLIIITLVLGIILLIISLVRKIVKR